ncbi:hypothetical protein K461DRAFT_266973 [Myriangium duriaei CBS 260.36]|uniref:Velvet domain-containing protein n=1 Tax=Myriangium duriaei CBS 260.36 TaxID=1168546 RepID=A0A9P4J2D2_9PEZI|nr:hypothetical protein K461DRAFT_266973 [Myriangium duriaei CBS 260.36]
MNYYYQPFGDQSQPQTSDSYYRLASEDYDIKIRQQPRDALLAQDGKEKARKPVDPPPIVEVNVREGADPIRQFLQSPYLFMTTSLVPADTQYADASLAIEKGLCGAVVSSLHKLKDTDSKDGGFFVFGDVSVKKLGEHRLLFSLFELHKNSGEVVWHKSILSDVFTVHPQKEYPGLEESTHLSRTFADQGVRLRLRKESRTMGGGSNRKRSFPYGSQSSSQVGSSSQAPSVRGVMSYTPGQVAGPAYPQLSRSPSKRQRSEESQYGGYSVPPRSVGDPNTGYGGLPDPYNSPTAGSRLQPPGSLLANRNRWSMYGGAAATSPQPSSDMSFRSTSLPRLDPSLSGGQPTTGVLPQGTVQQGSPASSSMGPTGATSFQQQPFSYGNVAATGGYPAFQQGQQYRADTGYPPQQSMYPSEHNVAQQYPDPSQGYPGYDSSNNGRTGYQVPSTRGWS